MAATRLPKPGTRLGPCASPCQHLDCASTRSHAEQPCPVCKAPIGYEVRYYCHDGVFVHADCEEDAVTA